LLNFNACDHFFWGSLKDSVYRNNLYMAEEPNGDITTAVDSITEGT
jgi:hypothetical protein